MTKIISLVGLPGSGKGTQATFISKYFDSPVISIGDVLRKMINDNPNSNSSIKASSYMSQGRLVPIEIISDILAKYLEKTNNKIIIFDGFPRNIEQYDFINKYFSSVSIIFLYFSISQELIKKRILGRFFCNKCGQLYNKYYKPTKVEGVCNFCNSSDLLVREDDDLQVFQKRLVEYQNSTALLLQKLNNANFSNLFEIDASLSSLDVQNSIEKILKNI
ncbi:MAG TPA: nucleoside monophosphate kinase [Candidatus Megaira endosymbiont of Hartmannula sinica]|nr:nucleoside monophosphate kinase [Candidatus Megaera endosymbiont of Hartmannula sinica]